MEIVRGEVGFAPGNLNSTLMSRQSLLQSGLKCDVRTALRCAILSLPEHTHTHTLAVEVAVDESDRPYDQKDDCKKFSHWHRTPNQPHVGVDLDTAWNHR